MIQKFFKRVRKRYLARKALTKPNLLYFLWRYVGNGLRTLRALIAGTSPEVSRLADEIKAQGLVMGPSNGFLTSEGQRAFVEASELVLAESRISQGETATETGLSRHKNKDYLVQLVDWRQEHSPDSPLVRLALDRKLLEIISSYFGFWPRLHAIGAWMNLPTDDEAKESQLWHRDPEDLQLVKVFIYLVDVDADRGPFSYIAKTHPFSSGAAKVPVHKDRKRITDEEMRVTFPAETWLTCTGPAGTMILADTVGYHRGGRPTKGSRILITFTYASGMPFTSRVLRVTGKPAWANTGVQSYAL